jgi:hypothetical protein
MQMRHEFKIIFLALASNNSEHEMDRIAQSSTWASNLDDSSKVIWVRGDPNSDYRFSDETLYVPCVESYENILLKTKLACKWIVDNYEFRTLVRTNVSTYFSPKFLPLISNLLSGEESNYGGYLMSTKANPTLNRKSEVFISGSGIFLGSKAAASIADADLSSYCDLPDDIALTRILKKSNGKFVYVPRVNLDTLHIPFNFSYVRCKSSIFPQAAGKRMSKLHSIENTKSPLLKTLYLLGLLKGELDYLEGLKNEIRRIYSTLKFNILGRTAYSKFLKVE